MSENVDIVVYETVENVTIAESEVTEVTDITVTVVSEPVTLIVRNGVDGRDGNTFTISDTAPESPLENDLWIQPVI